MVVLKHNELIVKTSYKQNISAYISIYFPLLKIQFFNNIYFLLTINKMCFLLLFFECHFKKSIKLTFLFEMIKRKNNGIKSLFFWFYGMFFDF